MPNFYTESCFAVPLKSNASDVQDTLDLIDGWLGQETAEPVTGEPLLKLLADVSEHCQALADALKEWVSDFECSSLSNLMSMTVRKQDDGCVVYFSDERCDSLSLEGAVLIARLLLCQEHSDHVVTASFALTCSRPVVDQSGGGVVVFNRYCEAWQDRAAVIEALWAEVEAKTPDAKQEAIRED